MRETTWDVGWIGCDVAVSDVVQENLCCFSCVGRARILLD